MIFLMTYLHVSFMYQMTENAPCFAPFFLRILEILTTENSCWCITGYM